MAIVNLKPKRALRRTHPFLTERPARSWWLFAALVAGLLGGATGGSGQTRSIPQPPVGISTQYTTVDSQRPIESGVVKPPGAMSLPESRLPVFELKMDPGDLRQLDRTVYSSDTYPATFIANGVVHGPVRVRFRGQWSRNWPKKPLKIFFAHAHPFEGRRCLNLNSGWQDPAFLREPLAYHVYAACGLPAPKARMVRLQVNGQFHGLYVEVEQPDKPFLTRLGLKGASLLKANSRSNEADERDLGSEESFRSHYDVETSQGDGLSELRLFCRDLARTKNAVEFFTQRMDLNKYINYLAVNVLIQNWDSYNKNHFLLYDVKGSKRWWVVPWDLDRTFGDHWSGGFDYAQLPVLLGTRHSPGITGWNRLEDRFFSDPALRSRFLDRLAELLEKEFTVEKLGPVLDRLEADITAESTLDRQSWPGNRPDLHRAVAQIKNYISHRRAYLTAELASLRQKSPP